jgi:hypothetical protein
MKNKKRNIKRAKPRKKPHYIGLSCYAQHLTIDDILVMIKENGKQAHSKFGKQTGIRIKNPGRTFLHIANDVPPKKEGHLKIVPILQDILL